MKIINTIYIVLQCRLVVLLAHRITCNNSKYNNKCSSNNNNSSSSSTASQRLPLKEPHHQVVDRSSLATTCHPVSILVYYKFLC